MTPEDDVEFTGTEETLDGWNEKMASDVSGMFPRAKYGSTFEALRKTLDQESACALFCKGKQCKFDRADWLKEQMAIDGLYSTWITSNILAMARPNTPNIIKFDIITQFRKNGIKSIFNLELPGEHASCGPGLEPSGFTYNPQQFMDNDIYFYNFGWPDWSFGSLSNVLDAVKVMQFSLSEGKVAVHCHAGHGRTGVLIACFLVYANRMDPWQAIHYVRTKRPQCLQTESQVLFTEKFGKYLQHLYTIFSLDSSDTEDSTFVEFTLPQFLDRQRKILHGPEIKKYKNIPKIIFKCCEQLLTLAGYSDKSLASSNKVTNTSNKCMQCLDGESIARAMAETKYDKETIHLVSELKKKLNTEISGYKELKKVTNPYVVSKLMWDWIDTLKEPVLPAQELPQMLEYIHDPKQGLLVLNKGVRHLVEHLFKTIARLEPLEDETERSVVQRTLSTLTQQNIVVEMELLYSTDGTIIQRTSNNDGELMRESMARRLLYFFMHLLSLLQFSISTKQQMCMDKKHSGQDNGQSGSEEIHETKVDQECTSVALSDPNHSRRRSSFISNMDYELL